MFSWFKKKGQYSEEKYDLDKKMQIECLVRYWFKTIEAHENRLPDDFIKDSVNPQTVVKFMTDVVQFGWKTSGKKMVGKEFSDGSVINPHIGALNCAALHYLSVFTDDDRSVYIGATWWAMCFAMLDDISKTSTTYELVIAMNCKEQLLNSRELAI